MPYTETTCPNLDKPFNHHLDCNCYLNTAITSTFCAFITMTQSTNLDCATHFPSSIITNGSISSTRYFDHNSCFFDNPINEHTSPVPLPPAHQVQLSSLTAQFLQHAALLALTVKVLEQWTTYHLLH